MPVGETTEEQTASVKREGSVEESPEPEAEFERLKADFTRDELASMMLGRAAQREARKVEREELKQTEGGSVLKALSAKRKRSISLTPYVKRDRCAGPVDGDKGTQSLRPVQKARKLRSAVAVDGDGALN